MAEQVFCRATCLGSRARINRFCIVINMELK